MTLIESTYIQSVPLWKKGKVAKESLAIILILMMLARRMFPGLIPSLTDHRE